MASGYYDFYVELRFGRVDQWCNGHPQYFCGWPNFEQADYHDGRGLVYGHYLLHDAVVDKRIVPAQEYGNLDDQPMRAWFTRANAYAVSQGYQHGFPVPTPNTAPGRRSPPTSSFPAPASSATFRWLNWVCGTRPSS